jgi:hypothetical protein
MDNYLVKAIKKLHPTAEFSLTDNNYKTIKWDVLDGEAPTQSEIDAEIERIKSDELTEIEAKANAKQTLLERLGITEEEAKLLLS